MSNNFQLKAKASELVSGLLQKGTDLLGKRATLSDHLQTIGNALSSAVSPFKDVSILELSILT